MLGHIEDGAAGDGRKDAVGLGSHHGVVLCNEDEVGSSGLLHICSCGSVQIHIFIIALLVGVHDGVEAHGIVQTGLYMAGAVGGCPVKVADADGDGLCTALKVGAHRRTEGAELVFAGRLYADDGIRSEHIGTDIEGRTGAEGRHIIGVGLYDLCNGLHEAFLGEYGHFQSLCRVFHPLAV